MATSSETTALVSGASGGLGKATAHALARTGARVLVHARTEERAVAAARELHGVPVWLAFTYALAHRLDHREITINAANPGNVATGFGRNGGVFRFFQGPARFLLSSPERGAHTAVSLASDPTLDTATGGYYTKGQPALSSATSRDPAYGEQVLAMTARLLARSGLGPNPFAGRAE